MRILPAGVPRGLSRFKQKLGAAAANTPLFFIGTVIAIAVLFRVGIGAVKPAALAEEEPARVSHVAVPVPQAAAPRPVVSATAPAVAPEPAETAPKPVLPRRKARTHGKR